MRQYVIVKQSRKKVRATLFQVDEGLFGESKHIEDQVTGSREFVKIYLETHYPNVEILTGINFLKATDR